MLRQLIRRVRHSGLTVRLLSGIEQIVWKVRFVGHSVRIHPTAYISRRCVIRARDGGSISIGAHCEIHDFAMLLTHGGPITIGDNCSVNPFTIVYGQGGTTIGKGVRIAAHCVIIPANHIRGDEERPLYMRGLTAQGIQIDDYAWLGAGCRILDGVKIGRHAVVGAGAVVTRSIPDFATAVGVPARVVGSSRDSHKE